MERFYPNECFVCKSPKNVKRCTRCQMIPYCGKDHQKQHLKSHMHLCKIIATIMKEKGVSHLFEELRGSNSSTWIEGKKKIAQDVQIKLGRCFRLDEAGMFQFPRACFVCYDTRQEKLKNCPGCSSATFCTDHPSSLIHDRTCSILKNQFELIIKNTAFAPWTSKSSIEAIGAGTIFPESGDFPKSMREFLDLYTKPKVNISENMKIINTEMFTISLTLFSILQILNEPLSSEIVLHVDVGPWNSPIMIGNYWEVLLHFLPDTKILKIVHIEGTITHKNEVFLCKKCRSSKRRLLIEANSIPYERYLEQRDYQTPNVIAYLNVDPPEKDDFRRRTWERTTMRMSKVTCPMALTTLSERGIFLAREVLTASTTNFLILYDGYNKFAPLVYHKELEDGTLLRNCQFMIVFKNQGTPSNGPDSISNCKTQVSRPRSFFYATLCQVCRSENPKVTCNRCRMIFYCGNKHRDEHQIHHRDICKVILGLLSEMEAPNLFDKFKTADPELWLRARIDLMEKAKLKIGRKLQEYEKQMFLFPKTCVVCHESDLSVLRNCECGVNLCKIHKEDPKHKKLCCVLTLALKLSISEQQPNLRGIFEVPTNDEAMNLPPSMQIFIDSYLKLKKESPKEKVDFEDMATSNFLTAPLTLLYAIKKLNHKIDSSMVIHIIGASSSDIVTENSWKLFLYWLGRLNNLKIVFIGPEVPNFLETRVDTSDFFFVAVKIFKVEFHALQYDEYFKSKSFIKPNIIFGCNLDIHESELGLSECNWKNIILTLKKVGVPFILTAGTEERAKKDHKTFCKLLGMSVDYNYFEVNPFAALSPERDFETEGVRYSNKYIIIYDGKYKELVKLNKKTSKDLAGKSSDVEKFKLEKKFSDCKISKD